MYLQPVSCISISSSKISRSMSRFDLFSLIITIWVCFDTGEGRWQSVFIVVGVRLPSVIMRAIQSYYTQTLAPSQLHSHSSLLSLSARDQEVSVSQFMFDQLSAPTVLGLSLQISSEAHMAPLENKKPPRLSVKSQSVDGCGQSSNLGVVKR